MSIPLPCSPAVRLSILVLLLCNPSHHAVAQKVSCALKRVDGDWHYVCEPVIGPNDREDPPTGSQGGSGGDDSGGAIPLPPSPNFTPPPPAPTFLPAPSSPLALEYVGEPPFDQPLKECQGDCNNDWQCAFGLNCFRRSGLNQVPGCEGLGIDMVDYCYVPPPGELVIVADENNQQNYPLGPCEGYCASDSDCAGTLQCYFRDRYEDVPGCTGIGARGTNYCYDPKNVTSQPTDRKSVV